MLPSAGWRVSCCPPSRARVSCWRWVGCPRHCLQGEWQLSPVSALENARVCTVDRSCGAPRLFPWAGLWFQENLVWLNKQLSPLSPLDEHKRVDSCVALWFLPRQVLLVAITQFYLIVLFWQQTAAPRTTQQQHRIDTQAVLCLQGLPWQCFLLITSWFWFLWYILYFKQPALIPYCCLTELMLIGKDKSNLSLNLLTEK